MREFFYENNFLFEKTYTKAAVVRSFENTNICMSRLPIKGQLQKVYRIWLVPDLIIIHNVGDELY